MTAGSSAPVARDNPGPQTEIVHGSCVSVRGRGVLIIGASGSGKSALALSLMSLGAALVADDRVCLTRTEDGIVASCPDAIRGQIEARGVGILHADPGTPVPVAVLVDMDLTEGERLPPLRMSRLLGQSLPLLMRVDAPYFPAALLQYLLAGRRDE